jgi:NAD(P)-dependent dehydrogenase (short-subunit alcohol dehydrogenase family)
MSDSARVHGKVIIVTGASSGIGKAFVESLAANGGTVVAVARRADRLAELARANPRIRPVTCDVTDVEAARRMIDEVIVDLGHVDVLVNNAGASRVLPAVDETPDSFRELLEVNLVAPFVLSTHVARSMIERGQGSIVNVASIVGLVGLGRMPQAGYAASKAGLVNLTRELAAQWARKGIRVNAIAPGWFPTEMTEGLFDNERGVNWVNSMVPMGRHGSIEELSGALLYLASDESSYTTGSILTVDGGWTAV